MEIFKNNFLMKLVATICLVIMLFSFVAPARVRAEDEVWGGVLLNPVIKLMAAIGDAIMGVLHESIQSQEMHMIEINGTQNFWEAFIKVVFAILVAVVVIAIVLATAGVSAAAVAALAGTSVKAAFVAAAVHVAGGAVLAGVTGGIITGVALEKGTIPNDIMLPAFSITAEEIFRNDIVLFDVNFFDPMPPKDIVSRKSSEGYYETVIIEQGNLTGETETNWMDGTDGFKELVPTKKTNMGYDDTTGSYSYLRDGIINYYTSGKYKMNITINELIDYFNGHIQKDTINAQLNDILNITDNALVAKGYNKIDRNKIASIKYGAIEDENGKSIISVSIENSLPIGGITTNENNNVRITIMRTFETITSEVVTGQIHSTASQLRGIISTWYVILRNMAILVLMLVLIYIGIRIVIGSTAGEKAKYKERLMDWLIAVCLIFIMHYIMFFAVELVEMITNLVGKTVNGNTAYIELTPEQEDDAKVKLEGYDTTGDGDAFHEENGKVALVWPTDLAGLYRIQSQATAIGTTTWAGYSLCYFILVLFTLFFAFTYAKRVIYMAFLTMIAPLVAMTYPIDKITDGKAQAFDTWLKEYIFNLMIQPLHLLLYNILISSAFKLATGSPLYALVALGFMMPAEKLMRRFFGFEKAKTPGLLGGAAGAALAMTGLQKIMGNHSKGKHSSNSYSEKENNANTKIRIPSNGSSTDMMLNNVELDSENDGKHKGLSNIPKQDASEANGSISNSENEIRTSFFGDEDEYEDMKRDQYQQSATLQETEKARKAQNIKVPEINKAARATMHKKATELSNQNKKKNHRVIKTAFAVSKAYARGLAKKTLRRMEKTRPVRAMVRGATGLTVGALGGLTGVALGVASGDPSKVLQYTSAGVLGGYGLGSGVAGSTVDTLSVNSNDVKKEAERAWYGDEYMDRKAEEYIKDNLETEQNMNFLQDVGYTREDAKEFLETSATEYYRSGVKDVEDMVTIERVINIEPKEGEARITRDEAIAATRMKKSLPQNIRDMSSKKEQEYYNTYRNTYQEKLRKKYPQWRENAELNKKINNLAESRANDTIRIMKTLESQKSSLPRM